MSERKDDCDCPAGWEKRCYVYLSDCPRRPSPPVGKHEPTRSERELMNNALRRSVNIVSSPVGETHEEGYWEAYPAEAEARICQLEAEREKMRTDFIETFETLTAEHRKDLFHVMDEKDALTAEREKMREELKRLSIATSRFKVAIEHHTGWLPKHPHMKPVVKALLSARALIGGKND